MKQIFLTMFLSSLLLSGCCLTREYGTAEVKAVYTAKAPVLDGKLSEKAWQKAPAYELEFSRKQKDDFHPVLQDFYKFTRNSVIVAYNIAFDYKFLYLAGNAQGYNFDNKQIDAMVLAKQKLKGLKNYKLKTVVTHLGVSLENAHRAVHDAIATAEAFVKLVDSDTVL